MYSKCNYVKEKRGIPVYITYIQYKTRQGIYSVVELENCILINLLMDCKFVRLILFDVAQHTRERERER
jgi:hypothetical protein